MDLFYSNSLIYFFLIMCNLFKTRNICNIPSMRFPIPTHSKMQQFLKQNQKQKSKNLFGENTFKTIWKHARGAPSLALPCFVHGLSLFWHIMLMEWWSHLKIKGTLRAFLPLHQWMMQYCARSFLCLYSEEQVRLFPP